MKRLVIVSGVVLFLSLFLRTISFAQVKVGTRYKSKAAVSSTKIFVKLRDRPNVVSLLSVSGSVNGNFVSSLPGTNTVVYQVSDVNSAIAAASSNSNVAYAGAVPKVYLTMITNDTHFDKQWALPNMVVGGNGSTAWDILGDVAGKTGAVKVAVVDTGVDRTHPDLTGKIADSDFVGCSGSGCSTSSSGSDDFGHGTHVAGIIGALTNNAKGIAGVGYGVRLMSAKILDSQGQGDLDVALQGVKWAADNGAKVINMSFGAPANGLTQTDKDTIQAMMDYAWGKGAVLVAAAGNCGGSDFNTDPGCSYGSPPVFVQNPVMYPAASNHVISVAALTYQNTLASYSEHGGWVDVAAPGGFFDCSANSNSCPSSGSNSCPDAGCGILSTWPAALITGQPPAPTPQFNYQYAMGTSMASPQVAGVAALIFAANPNFTSDQVKTFIENSANKGGGGAGNTVNGAVNGCTSVYAALNNGATPPGGTCVLGSSTTASPNPTAGPTNSQTQVVTPFPAGIGCPKTCKQLNPNYKGPDRAGGDADCNGTTDNNDYSVWSTQFNTPPPQTSPINANFSCTAGNPNTYLVNLVDFEIWRRGVTSPYAPSVTPGGPTDTPTPVVPTDTPEVPGPSDTPGPVSPTLPSGVGAGSYDDRASVITYTGTWANVNNVTGAYKSTLKRSRVLNDTASLVFTGSTVTIRYSKAQNRGIADILIDGVKVDSFDGYATAASAGIVWTKSYSVSSGTHTLTISVTHTKSNSATDFYVALDEIKIQ